MIALRKHCLFYGINRDVLFNERSGLQIGGALLYALELGTAFFVTFQFHVVAEDTDLVRFFEYIREIHHTDRKSTRLNSSHANESRMPSSA